MFSNIRNVAEHLPQNVQTKFHLTEKKSEVK